MMTKEEKDLLTKQISEQNELIDRLVDKKKFHDKEGDKLKRIIKKELDKLEIMTVKRWPPKKIVG
jgi:hypothetical protein